MIMMMHQLVLPLHLSYFLLLLITPTVNHLTKDIYNATVTAHITAVMQGSAKF